MDCLFQRVKMKFPGGSDGKASAYSVGDVGSIPGSGRSPGEGNGNPLQYSWLENPTDRGAWWATVHGSQRVGTQLSNFTFFGNFVISSRNALVEIQGEKKSRLPEHGGVLPQVSNLRAKKDAWSPGAQLVGSTEKAWGPHPRLPAPCKPRGAQEARGRPWRRPDEGGREGGSLGL